jgi:hypothetical protein
MSEPAKFGTIDGVIPAEPHTRLSVVLDAPNGVEPKDMTKEDVWGRFINEGTEEHKDRNGFTYLASKGHFEGGMIVARGHGHQDVSQTICPIFGGEVPWKSVTAVCPKEKEEEVIYWLEYVQGSNCINERKLLASGEVALRADYMAW